jgi:hypothetical protein
MNAQLQSLKRLFKRMSLREQFLALLFIVVMLSIWTGSCWGRYREWFSARKEATATLQTQQLWLDRAEDYAAGAAQAKQRLDPSRTYNATQLSGQIDKLVRQSQLSGKADLDPVKSREGEIFSEHTIRVRLKRISIEQLIQFNSLLRKETPYINQQSIRIAANRSKPEELDVRYEINSLELIESSL